MREPLRLLESRKAGYAMASSADDGWPQDDRIVIGQSPAIQSVLDLVARVAPTRATVLITGETGTGKELIARLLHTHSDRRHRPMLAVNCGALSDSLIESELFGHAKGAFTGAHASRAGKFAAAHGGTLFFDEITSMSDRTQAALLRVLQSGEFCPIGAEQPLICDVRVVAAANRELRERVDAGTFRADLFYRLNVIRIDLPPLRDRRDDLPLLIDHYLHEFATRYGRGEVKLDSASLRRLMDYDFPGNIRELQTLLHRATLLTDGPVIAIDDLSAGEATASAPAPRVDLHKFHRAKASVVEKFERDYLLAALQRTRGIVTEAARATGLSERNFHLKLRKYGLSRQNGLAVDGRDD